MFWEAKTIDGEIHKQIFGESYKDLDPTKVVELMLRDQPSAHSIPMDLNENLLKMPNFNQMLIEIMNEVPDIHLTYDEKVQGYRFDEKSLKFLKEAIIPFEGFYSSFGISNNTFLFDAFDIQLKFFIKLNNEYVSVFDLKPEKTEMLYFYNAQSEFKVGMAASKASTMTTSAQVELRNLYVIDGITYSFKAKLTYNFSMRTVELRVDYTSVGVDSDYRISYRTKDKQYSYEGRKTNHSIYHEAFLGTLAY